MGVTGQAWGTVARRLRRRGYVPELAPDRESADLARALPCEVCGGRCRAEVWRRADGRRRGYVVCSSCGTAWRE